MKAYSAAAYICGLDKPKYPKFLNEGATSYNAGDDLYSKRLIEAYKRVTGWNGGEVT